MSFPLTGTCLCGSVSFEVSEPFLSSNYCHCTRCQRRTGTAASANARARADSFRILSGEDRLRSYKPDTGAEKFFCGDCGSALFSRDPDDHDRVSIRLGAVDGDPQIRPTMRQFVAYAAPWEAIPEDGLTRHEESGLRAQEE